MGEPPYATADFNSGYSGTTVLIMIIETRYRGHTDDDAYDWARERLTEILSLLGEPAGDPA